MTASAALNFTPAVWESLVRRGVSPADIARQCPDLTEFECAAALKQAAGRLETAAREVNQRLRHATRIRETPEQAAVALSLRSGWK